MKATHRVKNSNGNTTGFIVDNRYMEYYTAVRYINIIENLTITKKGVIRVKNKKLPEKNVAEVNKQIYNRLCKENQLKRDVQLEFQHWKRGFNRLALYVKGARQIGKTTEIKKFAYNNYEQIIYFNLSDEEQQRCLEKIVGGSSLYCEMKIYCQESGLSDFEDNKNTVIIIDEIQESVKIYNSIRKLRNELNCNIIITGSYLGQILNPEYFKPAGDLYDLEVLPLSFQEFCRAFNSEQLLLQIGLYGTSNKEDYIKLTQLYKIYIQIGGYPSVVRRYIETKDIQETVKELGFILNRFTDESRHYFKSTKCLAVFKSTYKSALIQMTKEKKGTASKDIQTITDFVRISTKEHVSRSEVNDAITWLIYGGIINTCDLYNQGNPLDILFDRRMYFMDCGLLKYIASSTPLSEEAVQGILAENFVYTELYRLYANYSNRLKGDKPACSVYNNYELDFMLIDREDKKYGIEVKSNKSNKHKSLDIYKERNFIDEGYLVEITKGGKGKHISSIPIYTVGCRFPYD